MTFQRLKMFFRFLTCFLILLAVAVQRNGSVAGKDLTVDEKAAVPLSVVTSNGAVVTINTTDIADNIKGYGGPTPLEIKIEDGKIAEITALKNAETEGFFNRVRNELIPKWIGVPVAEVADMNVDAVTGATLSSRAVNATVKTGIAYAQENNIEPSLHSSADSFLSLKYIASLVVLLCAAIMPLFLHGKGYRYIQLSLNIVVLGFWCGTFLSYEVFVNYIANGANVLQSLPIFMMLIMAFVYPYFGRKSHYCSWVCPLGSLQEIAGKLTRFKLKMSPELIKRLSNFQECLWAGLLFVMCAGIWFDWMNWELFRAFIFRQAAPGVIIASGVFVLLSVIVNRPYCRFVCPTGCLFQITQNPNK